jgi:hypothetical protein
MANSTAQTIYYLRGYGGQLASGLGRALMDRGFDVAGRETRGDFRLLPFDEQIATVGQDLKDHFWHADARVICNSFGAYLFLSAQTQIVDSSTKLSQGGCQPIGAQAGDYAFEQPTKQRMAESFVKTLKRDYAKLADRPDSKTVMAQLPKWFDDYNSYHPHSALGYVPAKLFREKRSVN